MFLKTRKIKKIVYRQQYCLLYLCSSPEVTSHRAPVISLKKHFLKSFKIQATARYSSSTTAVYRYHCLTSVHCCCCVLVSSTWYQLCYCGTPRGVLRVYSQPLKSRVKVSSKSYRRKEDGQTDRQIDRHRTSRSRTPTLPKQVRHESPAVANPALYHHTNSPSLSTLCVKRVRNCYNTYIYVCVYTACVYTTTVIQLCMMFYIQNSTYMKCIHRVRTRQQ